MMVSLSYVLMVDGLGAKTLISIAFDFLHEAAAKRLKRRRPCLLRISDKKLHYRRRALSLAECGSL